MTTIHKLRIILDTEEDIFRDVEIAANDSLLHLHEAILSAFDIPQGEMASFYRTNDQWDQGEEIPIMSMEMEDHASHMEKTEISSLLNKSGDRLLYVYDFLNLWTFFVEFITSFPAQEGVDYPIVSLSYGKTPDSAPGKDFGGESKGGGLFGGAFGNEEDEDDDFDPDELPDGEEMWE